MFLKKIKHITDRAKSAYPYPIYLGAPCRLEMFQNGPAKHVVLIIIASYCNI